jgi:hypothetical protein
MRLKWEGRPASGADDDVRVVGIVGPMDEPNNVLMARSVRRDGIMESPKRRGGRLGDLRCEVGRAGDWFCADVREPD